MIKINVNTFLLYFWSFKLWIKVVLFEIYLSYHIKDRGHIKSGSFYDTILTQKDAILVNYIRGLTFFHKGQTYPGLKCKD